MKNLKDLKFIKRWDLDTDIQWRLEARTELNKIIDHYNQWLIFGALPDQAPTLQRFIEYGIQTIGTLDGGEAYLKQLEEMEAEVKRLITV